MGKDDETILCFPRDVLEDIGYFEGVCTDLDRYFPAIVEKPHAVYLRRGDAEDDPSFLQVIPYAIVLHDETVFCYRRGKRGSEERLHEQYSIGVGGHINPEDRGLFSEDQVGYEDAMWREVREELQLDTAYREACVGLINVDETPVDRVHFGIVHIIEVKDPGKVRKNEAPITDVDFVPIGQARSEPEKFENWSKLCLESMEQLAAAARKQFDSGDGDFVR